MGEKKTGLVLEGGGMRGIYTAGVLDVFMENGITFDGVIGVSAGAIHGCSFVSGQKGRSIRYYMKYCRNWQFMSFRSLLLTGNIAGEKFCYHTLPEKLDPYDYEAFKKSPTKFYVGCSNVETGKAEYLPITDMKEQIDRMRASASLPLVSKIVKTAGLKLLDGGCTDSIPVKAFAKMGYTKDVVVLTRHKGYRKEIEGTGLTKLVYRKYPEFVKAVYKRPDVYNHTLDEIENAVTKKTYASFEPMLDYCVVKIPRLPFDKFITAKRTLTTQMKATGEVMSIGTNFEGALMKAIRSLEQHVDSLIFGDYDKLTDDELLKELEKIDDLRIYVIAEAIRRGFDYDTIFNITKIDRWFLDKIAVLVEMEKKLAEADTLDKELLQEAKRLEFPDKVIGSLTGKTEREIKELRNEYNIHAAYKMVDTCAAEFDAATPYYYSCYDGENEVKETSEKKKVMVLGSGPIRIGQGIEFDFCSVHSVWALSKEGYETIIVNNNPETVSTDFDVADKLYFEPLTAEDVEKALQVKIRIVKSDGQDFVHAILDPSSEPEPEPKEEGLPGEEYGYEGYELDEIWEDEDEYIEDDETESER